MSSRINNYQLPTDAYIPPGMKTTAPIPPPPPVVRRLSFADAVATRYQSPLDIAHKFHADAQSEALLIGVLLPDVIDFNGVWTYASNAAGNDDKRQGYIAEIQQRDDNLIRPVITINSYRHGGDTLRWCPDDLLWSEHTSTEVIHKAHDPEKYKVRAAALAKEHAIKRDAREKADATGRAVVAMTAARVFESAQDCTGHDYLTNKGIGSHGAKIATQRITGTLYNQMEGKTFEGAVCDAGDLLIPLYKEGSLVSLQRIKSDGSKRFLMGGATAGAYYIIKGTEDGQAFIAEGFATGATVCEATGRSVYVAFSAYNLKAVVDSNLNIGAVAADANDAGTKGALATGLPLYSPPDTTGGDDWNDYAKLKGLSAIKSALQNATLSPPPPPPATNAPDTTHELNKWHSLTREVDLSATVTPPRWILPNFIAEGIALIAGGHGVGKTTTLLPLAMAAAGIHEDGYQLAPKHWRHVVYITEDVGQAKLIINGWMNAAGLDYDHLKERVHIVEASRMPPEQVVRIGQWYAQKYTRTVTTATVGDVDVLPLVVIDTMAATFELENENDNAEASRMIALLKQQFCNLPVWIVGHVSKGDLSRDGAKSGNPTLRGASAFEADSNQVLYLVNDDGNRWLVRGKSRFESPWFELMIETDYRTVTALNAFGDQEPLIQRWGIARPSIKTRTDLINENKEVAAVRTNEMVTIAICDFIGDAEEQRKPVTKTEVVSSVKGLRSDAKRELIEKLLNQKRLAEITLPACVTGLARERVYLAVLNLGEQEEYKATGVMPDHKIAQYYAFFQQSEA